MSERSNGKNSPCTVGKVDRDGIDSIVNLQLEETCRSSNIDPSGNNADQASGSRSDDGAAAVIATRPLRQPFMAMVRS